jgi:hypothetical protein
VRFVVHRVRATAGGRRVTATTKYAFRTHLCHRGTGCQRKVARQRWRRRTSAVWGSAMRQQLGSIWHPPGGSGRLFRLLRRGRRGESIPLDLSYLNELDGCAVTETLPMPTPASDAHSPATRSRVVLRVLPATHPTSGVGKTRDQAPDHTGPSGTNEKDGTRAWRDRRSASGSRPTTTR